MLYRRDQTAGGCYFFTHVIADRTKPMLTEHIDLLRQAFQQVKRRYPFKLHALVVMPDHFHCVLELPAGDCRYPLRFMLIKMLFTRALLKSKQINHNCPSKQIWQHRYWEHLIRDDQDFFNHLNYIHWNPVKHQIVNSVQEWPFSTFHYYVAIGWYPANWGGNEQLHYESSQDAGYGE